MTFDEVERAIDAVQRGEFVVVVDDEDRENEGDLIIAADHMTPDKMAFMIRYTSGVICLPMEGARLDELQLPLMVAGGHAQHLVAYIAPIVLGMRGAPGLALPGPATIADADRYALADVRQLGPDVRLDYELAR